MKRNLLALLLCLVMVFSLAACSNGNTTNDDNNVENEEDVVDAVGGDIAEEEVPTSVTITTLNGAKEEIELEVPYNPQRIAVMDLACLDIIDNLGYGDRVVGVSKGSTIDYLQGYIANDDITNLGTIKEADLEAVMACEPDIIFIGGRLSSYYDELIQIAPVFLISTNYEIGLVESVRNNAIAISSMFGAEDAVTELMNGFDARITTLQAVAEGKTAMVGMVTSGSFNVLGNDARCSIIGTEIGFENIGIVEESETSTHGNESSFELILQLNPDYIFCMDRDTAIATEGAQTAQEIMENELVMQADAYQNGNIVYLAHPNVWYTAEGGVTALDVMLQDLEAALLG